MWFSVVCTLTDNEFVVDSRGAAEWVHNILTTVMTNIVVDKSTDNAEPHSICFLPQYQRQRKFLQQLPKFPRADWREQRCPDSYHATTENYPIQLRD